MPGDFFLYIAGEGDFLADETAAGEDDSDSDASDTVTGESVVDAANEKVVGEHAMGLMGDAVTVESEGGTVNEKVVPGYVRV